MGCIKRQMWGKGKSIGQSRSTCPGRKTLKKCNNNEDADNVVLIDVDSDNINNVIIIDVPESLKQKLRGSSVLRKEKNCQLRTIICIDDDDDKESSDSIHPGTGEEGSGEFCSDTSSSGRFCPALNHTQNSEDAVGDECLFVEETLSPVKLSRCKRTYSGKASSGNCYGLDPDSDSGSSDNDCEFMEDSFGKLRKQWEKANMKKKYDVRNGQSGRGDHTTSVGLRPGIQKKVDVEIIDDLCTEAHLCPGSSNVDFDEENQSPFAQTGVENLGSTSENPKKTPADFGLKSTQETQFSDNKAGYGVRVESFPSDPPFNNAEGEGQYTEYVKHGGSSFHNESDDCSRGPSLCSNHEQINGQVNHTVRFSQDNEKTTSAEHCTSNPEPAVDIDFRRGKASLPDEEVSFFRTQHSVDTEVGLGRKKFPQAPSCKSHFPKEFENGSNSSVDKEKLVSGEPLFQKIKPFDETLINHYVANNEVAADTGETLCERPPLRNPVSKKEKGFCHDKEKPFPEEKSFFSVPQNEAHAEPNMETRELSDEFMPNHQQEEEQDGPLHSHNGDAMNAVQGCIISEREKLKKTDEYKRAVEEEWASRQRELQLQAEEAQRLRRLRKRKKAENMRLLDMERRQKQRVEEMREIQKKDEENMSMKEQLRAEVRKELNQLEIKCHDMASLLRGLGIHVPGGFQPLPHEVRAAYKRALLSFHPDRASGSDIRQLVEAEEKFKLISRMKEKFLSTS